MTTNKTSSTKKIYTKNNAQILNKVIACSKPHSIFQKMIIDGSIKKYRNKCLESFSNWNSLLEVLKDPSIRDIKFKNCLTGDGAIITAKNCDETLPTLLGTYILDVNICKKDNPGVLRECDLLRSARLTIDGKNMRVKVDSLALPRTAEIELGFKEIEDKFTSIHCSKKVDGSLAILTITEEGDALINTKRTARGDHATLVTDFLKEKGLIDGEKRTKVLSPGTYIFELLTKDHNPFAIQEQTEETSLVFLIAWDHKNNPISPKIRSIKENESYTTVADLKKALEKSDKQFEGLVVWGVEKDSKYLWCFKLKNEHWKIAHKEKSDAQRYGNTEAINAYKNIKKKDSEKFRKIAKNIQERKDEKEFRATIGKLNWDEETKSLGDIILNHLKPASDSEKKARKISSNKKIEKTDLKQQLSHLLFFLVKMRLVNNNQGPKASKMVGKLKNIKELWRQVFKDHSADQIVHVLNWFSENHSNISGLPTSQEVARLIKDENWDEIRVETLRLYALSITVSDSETREALSGEVHFIGDPTSTDIDCIFLTEKTPSSLDSVETFVREHISKLKENPIENKKLAQLLEGFPKKECDITVVVQTQQQLKVLKGLKNTEMQAIIDTLKHTYSLYTDKPTEKLEKIFAYCADPNNPLTVYQRCNDIFKRFYDLSSDSFKAYSSIAVTVFKFLKRLSDSSFLESIQSQKELALINDCVVYNEGGVQLKEEVKDFLSTHLPKDAEATINGLSEFLKTPALTREQDDTFKILIFRLHLSILKDLVLKKSLTDTRLDIYSKSNKDTSAGFLKSLALKSLQAIVFDHLSAQELDKTITQQLYIKQQLLNYAIKEDIIPKEIQEGLKIMLLRVPIQDSHKKDVQKALEWIEETTLSLGKKHFKTTLLDGVTLEASELSKKDPNLKEQDLNQLLRTLQVDTRLAKMDEHSLSALTYSQIYSPYSIASDLLLKVGDCVYPIEIKSCSDNSPKEIERCLKGAYKQLHRASKITGAKKGIVIICTKGENDTDYQLRFIECNLNPYANFSQKKPSTTNKTDFKKLEKGNEIEHLVIATVEAAMSQAKSSKEHLRTIRKEITKVFNPKKNNNEEHIPLKLGPLLKISDQTKTFTEAQQNVLAYIETHKESLDPYKQSLSKIIAENFKSPYSQENALLLFLKFLVGQNTAPLNGVEIEKATLAI